MYVVIFRGIHFKANLPNFGDYVRYVVVWISPRSTSARLPPPPITFSFLNWFKM